MALDITTALELVRAGFSAEEVRAMAKPAQRLSSCDTGRTPDMSTPTGTPKRKPTKTSRKADKRQKAVTEFLTMRPGVYGVTEVARMMSVETPFRGMKESSIRQMIYAMVRTGLIGKSDDSKLYAPPVPDDASSLDSSELAAA